MNVLCDFHHTDLFRSLRCLFEKRLGFHFFRPVGLDWWTEEYFYHPEPVYGKGCLQREKFHTDHLRDYPGPSHYPHGLDALEWSWITLHEAAQKIDLIVVTHPSNEQAFLRFRERFRPKAKVIRYIGNEGEHPGDGFVNLLCANKQIHNKLKSTKHSIHFHPEFDLEVYKWTNPPHLKKPVIRTFLNYIYHDAPQSDKNLYQYHKKKLRWKTNFYTHGLGTPPRRVKLSPNVPLWKYICDRYGDNFHMPDLNTNDGEPQTHEEIGGLMQNTNLAWHVKRADGYGYAIHQLYACGRPIICERSNYIDKTAEKLLVDTKTCVMLDGNHAQDIKKILFYLKREENLRMCENAYTIFKASIDFQSEANQIKKFIDLLI